MLKTALIVAGVVVVIVVAVLVYKYSKYKQSQEPMLISRPKLISNVPAIEGKKLPLSSTGQEFTYNFWIFIREWDSNDKPKCVLYRGNGGPTDFTVAAPSIWLYPKENKLMVRVSTMEPETSSNYDDATYFKYRRDEGNYSNVNPNASYPAGENIFDSSYACDVENIPLQRWVQVSVVMFNRTLDIYINGKLARSCILPGVPAHDPNLLDSVYIGKGNTFNGYISRFKYFNRAITANDVYSLYRKGPLPANWWWQNMKNRVKVILEIDSDA